MRKLLVQRRGAGLASLALLVLWVLSCHEPAAPPPPPTLEPDYVGVYEPATGTLEFPADRLDPNLGRLRLVTAGAVFDSATRTVRAAVALVNAGAAPVAGPDGVVVFDLSPAAVTLVNGVCDPPDVTVPALPGRSPCLIDYRGAFGADGMLDPGETSQPMLWVLGDSANARFELRARTVQSGLARPGEIWITLFDDRDSDGSRDPSEPGVSSSFLLAGPDSTTWASTDSSGHRSVQVVAPGLYRLRRYASLGCCPTTAMQMEIVISRREDGQLSAYGDARFGCRPGAPRLPAVHYVDVRVQGPDYPPCTAEACSVPFGRPFAVRFTGTAACVPIVGFQWQAILPADVCCFPWQPLGSDTLFAPAGRDTVALAPGGLDTLWMLRNDSVTVFFKNSGNDTLHAGNLIFRARVRDAEGMNSLLSQSTRRIAINLEPNTEIQAIAACECPAPPPECAQRPPQPLGWVTGIGAIDFAVDQWLPFCAGDTLPQHSRVRFFALGQDDPRDVPVHPNTGLRETGYAFRFEWRALELIHMNMPYSTEYPAADFALPGGATWRGGAAGWEVCPFDFTFFAASVDEHGTRDGTPATLPFYASGSPSIDSLSVPSVIVLVPTCPPERPLCQVPGSFGLDTLAVLGRHVPDIAYPTQTPLRLGYNEFALPLRGWGHDHPMDRNAPGREVYAPGTEGRIRAWRFSLDCVQPGCSDVALPREDTWVDDRSGVADPPGQQLFDELPVVKFMLDTLCTTSPCTTASMRVVLDTDRLGAYVFTLRGRDTASADVCAEPSDLGSHPWTFTRPTGDFGRTTGLATGSVVLRQLREVRGTPTARGAGGR